MRHTENRKLLIDHLEGVVNFCRENGIRTTKELGAMHMREALDHSLWKLLELDGKYGGRFVSNGVRELEERFNAKPSLRYGKWPDDVITTLVEEGYFDGDNSKKDFDCRLDHVITRQLLRTALLSGQIQPKEVGRHLLGCVVLHKEHSRIANKGATLTDPWKGYRSANPEVKVYDRIQCRYLDLVENSYDANLRNLSDQ